MGQLQGPTNSTLRAGHALMGHVCSPTDSSFPTHTATRIIGTVSYDVSGKSGPFHFTFGSAGYSSVPVNVASRVRYKALAAGVIREGAGRDSAKTGKLEEGELIVALRSSSGIRDASNFVVRFALIWDWR